MATIQVPILIDKPRSEVWAELSRLDRHAEWMTDAEEITFAQGPTTGIGTKMDVLTKVGPFRLLDRIVVVEWTEGRSIGVEHQGLVSGVGSFRLDDESSATRFTWTETLSFPWYLGGPVTALAARPILARIWRANLQRFAESVP